MPVSVAVGSVLFLMASYSFSTVEVTLLAFAIALLIALTLLHLREGRLRHREWTTIFSTLPTPLALAATPGFYQQYARIAEAITKASQHGDSVFRSLALTHMEGVAENLGTLAQDRIIFHATETWRTAYQHILETLRVKTYYSVAWVRKNEYWNDAPGRQSMKLNFELIGRGFRIERIHILSDEVWPFDQKLPGAGVLEWLVEQQSRGIHVSLMRESDIAKEADLLADFAFYGDRAIGVQEMDEQARTVRFVLSFDQAGIRQALVRWERLALYAKPFGDFMDQLQS